MAEIKKIDLSDVKSKQAATAAVPQKGFSLKVLGNSWLMASKKEKIEVVAVVIILSTMLGFFSYYLINRKPAVLPSSLPFPPATEESMPSMQQNP